MRTRTMIGTKPQSRMVERTTSPWLSICQQIFMDIRPLYEVNRSRAYTGAAWVWMTPLVKIHDRPLKETLFVLSRSYLCPRPLDELL